MLTVTVLYAPDAVTHLHTTVEIKHGDSLHKAILATGWSTQYPEVLTHSVGIFSKKVDRHDYRPQAGDRIEIYRPLTITPMQRRHLLASKQNRQASS